MLMIEINSFRQPVKWLVRTASLAIVCLVPIACTTVDSQSFVVSQESSVQSAQIATDADFGQYHQLQSGGFGIYFPEGSGMPAADLQRLRQTFVKAFRMELEGYTIVDEPGPGTMRVESSLIDLRNSGGATLPSLRSDISEIAQPGNLVFLMEMKDSVTGRILARAADSAKTPTIATTADAETDWASVDDAASHWAALFRRFLDEELGR